MARLLVEKPNTGRKSVPFELDIQVEGPRATLDRVEHDVANAAQFVRGNLTDFVTALLEEAIVQVDGAD